MTEKDQRELHMDLEANYFAMCLLMPAEMLQRDIARMFPDGIDPVDDHDLSELAKRYGVSRHLMALRLAQLESNK